MRSDVTRSTAGSDERYDRSRRVNDSSRPTDPMPTPSFGKANVRKTYTPPPGPHCTIPPTSILRTALHTYTRFHRTRTIESPCFIDKIGMITPLIPTPSPIRATHVGVHSFPACQHTPDISTPHPPFTPMSRIGSVHKRPAIRLCLPLPAYEKGRARRPFVQHRFPVSARTAAPANPGTPRHARIRPAPPADAWPESSWA